MPSRRNLLVAALTLPVAATLLRLAAPLRSLTTAARPALAGSSAARCAACGAEDHAMLDGRCPAAPRVLG